MLHVYLCECVCVYSVPGVIPKCRSINWHLFKWLSRVVCSNDHDLFICEYTRQAAVCVDDDDDLTRTPPARCSRPQCNAHKLLYFNAQICVYVHVNSHSSLPNRLLNHRIRFINIVCADVSCVCLRLCTSAKED